MSSNNAAAVIDDAPVMGFDDVVAANGVQYEEMAAWGGKVGLMSVMAGEVLDWLEKKDDPTKAKEAGLLLVARSLVGPDKKRLSEYDPAKEQQLVDQLKLKDSRTVNMIVERIMIMNGIKTTPVQAKNDSAASS
jgi:hypothetical protein